MDTVKKAAQEFQNEGKMGENEARVGKNEERMEENMVRGRRMEE